MFAIATWSSNIFYIETSVNLFYQEHQLLDATPLPPARSTPQKNCIHTDLINHAACHAHERYMEIDDINNILHITLSEDKSSIVTLYSSQISE